MACLRVRGCSGLALGGARARALRRRATAAEAAAVRAQRYERWRLLPSGATCWSAHCCMRWRVPLQSQYNRGSATLRV
eukprot:COSAG06_NODE_52856_length_303_cov_1.004902_1_plen_77_part_01